MFEQIVLGAIQGVTEWIPVSSKSCVIAAKEHFFHDPSPYNVLLSYALFLHLGTLVAAVIYFWKDIVGMFRSVGAPQKAENADAFKLLIFLVITTALTGLGLFVVKGVTFLAYSAPNAKRLITSLIAAFLIVTGFLQWKVTAQGKRTTKDIVVPDAILLGIVQALATLPGLSRSGSTIAALAFRKFDKEYALKISFLMSLPVIFIGNIVLNYRAFFHFGVEWVGVLTSLVVGLLTVRAVMRLTARINFGGFLIAVGSILAIAAISGALD